MTMKKTVYIILSLFFVMCFASCASNDVVAEPAVSTKNNKQTEKKLRFEDWKYKGFGKELPVWIEPALAQDINTLKKLVPEMANASVVKVLAGTGENSDQADQTAKELANDLLQENSDLTFFANFWVLDSKKSDKPYVALYIYYK